jgi:hypothetical protein
VRFEAADAKAMSATLDDEREPKVLRRAVRSRS